MGPLVFKPLREVAELAAGGIDPVVHVALASRRLEWTIARWISMDRIPEGWSRDVDDALSRCVRSLELEIVQIRFALSCLIAVIDQLQERTT